MSPCGCLCLVRECVSEWRAEFVSWWVAALVLFIKESPRDKVGAHRTLCTAQHNTVHDLTTGALSALLPMSSLVLLSWLRHCSHAGCAIILVLFLLGQLVAVPDTSWGRPSTW